MISGDKKSVKTIQATKFTLKKKTTYTHTLAQPQTSHQLIDQPACVIDGGR